MSSGAAGPPSLAASARQAEGTGQPGGARTSALGGGALHLQGTVHLEMDPPGEEAGKENPLRQCTAHSKTRPAETPAPRRKAGLGNPPYHESGAPSPFDVPKAGGRALPVGPFRVVRVFRGNSKPTDRPASHRLGDGWRPVLLQGEAPRSREASARQAFTILAIDRSL